MVLNLRKGKISYILLISIIFILAIGSIFFLRPEPNYSKIPPPELPAPPLKELAERQNIQIGSFAALKYLPERAYSEILSSEFEYAIIDGQPNWSFEDGDLRPGPQAFDFSRFDQVFAFADDHDIPVRVQHYVWGEEKWLPEWLKSGSYSKEELLDLLHDHIQTVGTRYKGKVREYTVVNEAFSRKLGVNGLSDWWGDRIGEEYIDKSFRWARQADPDSILILNDFGNETENDVSNAMYDYVKGALERDVPIDAIGMQMHLSGDSSPKKEDVVKNMNRFAGLGLKIYITEFDVTMTGLDKPKEEENKIQAQIYYDMLSACREVGPEVCPNFGLLGLVDRQSWYNGLGIKDANPLTFEDDYTPKPAFFALRDALK
ncbi:MAG TPA: endo-1,4-beta-xylanase [Candidatus Saccharimonadales bacterium]|nr:endo-1,4-beta-xylanase [Candidatus Saccharimonadales bacterium]